MNILLEGNDLGIVLTSSESENSLDEMAILISNERETMSNLKNEGLLNSGDSKITIK